METPLIWEGKITEKEGVELTDRQRRHIIESMNAWLFYHLPHNKLVNTEATMLKID